MTNRSIREIMEEGQAKTLEQMALLEKQLAGTLTPDESVRLAMLNGNLLALVKEAQAQGVGTAVGAVYAPQGETSEDDELDEWGEDEIDEDEDLLDLDEPQGNFGFGR